MMLDFWPFNAQASEWWAIIYVLICLVITFVTAKIAAAVGRSFDRQRNGEDSSPLRIGQMPQPDQWLAIAYGEEE